MKIRTYLAICAPLLVINPAAAWANEACSPAKKLVQGAKGFYGSAPELTNIINPELSIGFSGLNGHPDPAELLYRFEDIEHRLPIVDGRLQNLELAASWPSKGELCSIYADGPLPKTDEDTTRLSVSFEFPYLRKDGAFTFNEIKEGAKDGSKIIKSMAPKGLGFAAPGLKTFVVIPAAPEGEMPKLVFLRKGDPKDVETSIFNGWQFIRLKDLKSAKVDAVQIDGAHKAIAFFKIDPEELAEGEAKRLAELEANKN